MNKPLLLMSAPVDTMSGYGYRGADVARAIIELDKYDVKIISTSWGNTPFGALKSDVERDKIILDRIVTNIDRQPDIFVQVTVPNEFQPIGKYNIGITAGIETTVASAPWIEGCNRMNLVLVSSKHAKDVFESSEYEKKSKDGQPLGNLKLNTKIDILFEGFNQEVFKKTNDIPHEISSLVDDIPESFCYLYVGHWLPGDIGHDRKNTGMLIKKFFDTFYGLENKPALIMKVSTGNYSISDRNRIIDKIGEIQKMYADQSKLPNIYIIHGDLTQSELNGLYNHKKVKYMVNITHGEGFCRPLLEFASIDKPIIASGWSGHTDYLEPNSHYLLPGELANVHSSVVWENVILPESKWFVPNYEHFGQVLMSSFVEPNTFKNNAQKSTSRIRSDWSYIAMVRKVRKLFEQYIPEFGQKQTLRLPDGI